MAVYRLESKNPMSILELKCRECGALICCLPGFDSGPCLIWQEKRKLDPKAACIQCHSFYDCKPFEP